MSIMDYFPYETPRKCQIEALTTVEKYYDDFDVFVITAPTGAGKAGIGVAIQSWELARGNSCAYTVPNNILRNQLLDDFDHLKTVKSQDEYWIERYNMTEKDFRKKIYKYGPRDSEYEKDRRLAKKVGTPVVSNFHSFLAHKLQRNTLIIDEAHNMLPMLQNLHSRKIWRHLHGYPMMAQTVSDIMEWIEGKGEVSGILAKLRNEIKSLSEGTLIQMSQDNYRGVDMDCLKLIPFDVSKEPPTFWPQKKTKKIVMMSATINESDIELMGLASKRVLYVEVESPIPVERRPVKFVPVANMSMKFQDTSLDLMVDKIMELASSHKEKGFIHATYDVARKLQERIKDDRFMFHNNKNKDDVYRSFYSSDPAQGKILVGSGMYEGVDLKYDVANWQILVKCPYPSLMNHAVRWVSRNKPELYQWMTSKDILQACGRVCRSETDYGITYLFDTKFESWYNNNKATLPKWFSVEL